MAGADLPPLPKTKGDYYMKNTVSNYISGYTPKAGEVYFMKGTGVEVGCEEKKSRYWVVVRKTDYGMNVIVAPLIPDSISRQGRSHIEWVRTCATGEPRIIALNQCKSTDPGRLLPCNRRGRITKEELKAIYDQTAEIYLRLAAQIGKDTDLPEAG